MMRELDAGGSLFGSSYFGTSFFGHRFFGGNSMSLASLLSASQHARWEQRDAAAALDAATTRKADADTGATQADAAFAAALTAAGGSAIDRRGAAPVLYVATGDTYTATTLPAIEDDTIQGGGGGDTIQGGAGNDVVLVD